MQLSIPKCNSLLRATLVAATLLSLASSVSADMTITITEQPSGGIEFAWVGSGTILGGAASVPGTTLTFDNMNFIGTDDSDDIDMVGIGVDLSGLNLSYGGSPVTFGLFDFEDDGSGAVDDFRITTTPGGTGSPADTWAASGSFVTTAAQYPFSNLIPGGPLTPDATGDVTAFGGVSVTITAVPEPSSFLLIAFVSIGFVAYRWKRAVA